MERGWRLRRVAFQSLPAESTRQVGLGFGCASVSRGTEVSREPWRALHREGRIGEKEGSSAAQPGGGVWCASTADALRMLRAPRHVPSGLCVVERLEGRAGCCTSRMVSGCLRA